MKKISCIGFHATGSGVIDDLLRECDNVVQGIPDCESRFLQDPDGIADLEYNLIDNHHRINSGFAVKRYLRYVDRTKRTYVKIFGPEWQKISHKYIQSLLDFEYKGFWYGDLWLSNKIVNCYYIIRRQWDKRIRKKILHKKSYRNHLPWITSYYVTIEKDEFLEKTRNYIDSLCESMNINNKEFVVLDQLVPPTNIAKYNRYLRDIKYVIVDRDPRDVYIYLHEVQDRVMPIDDPYKFCKYFRDSHKQLSDFPNNCLLVHFEDMVLHYDKFVPLVMRFLGIEPSHHIAPRKHFDPTKSVKGVRTWVRHPEYSEDIEIITRELTEFLYHF